MVQDLDNLRQQPVGRHPGKAQPRRFEAVAIGDIDLVAVAVPLADPVGTVNRGDAAFRVEHRVIGPEAHRAAEIAIGLTLFQFVAAHPLGHQTDDRVLARAELGRAGARQPRQMPRRLDDRHLHAETDAEIRDVALARETCRLDLTLGAALAEAAGDEDRVHAFELLHRLALGLEDLGIDPVELDADIVGDAAMGHRFGERFVAVREVRVLANDRDVDLALRPADAVNDRVPAGQIGLARLKPEMGADFAVKAFGMIGAGNRVDRVDIDRRDDARFAQIAEQRDLLAGAVRDRALAAAQQNIGLDTKP